MVICSQSHLNNCTLKNALSWGICRSHIKEIRLCKNRNERITHLVLAILEAIPIVGQLISFIEYQYIHLIAKRLPIIAKRLPIIASKRPQYASIIPQFEKVFVQERKEDIRQIWPKDLNLLGITQNDQTLIEKHIQRGHEALRQGGTLSYSKKFMQYKLGDQEVSATLPITVNFLKLENNSFRVLLFPKKLFATGGERKIRWVYDLTQGDFLLKKPIVGLFEEQILKLVISLRQNQGFQTSVTWRNATSKFNTPKLQIIEPIRDGIISTLFGKAPLAHFSAKKAIILDLLADLNRLHQTILSDVKMTSRFESSTLPNFNGFHADIKSDNILVFFQNGRLRAELTDFGSSTANPSMFSITEGYTPPEYIRMYKEIKPFGLYQDGWFNDGMKLVNFNLRHGKARDIWSLGLVMLSLLTEREDEVLIRNDWNNTIKKGKIAPLPSLHSIFKTNIRDCYDEAEILNVKQEDIDAELYQLEKDVNLIHPQDTLEVGKMFKMLREMMLRINPEERKNCTECLLHLKDDVTQVA